MLAKSTTDSKQKAFRTHPKVNLLSKELLVWCFDALVQQENNCYVVADKIFLRPLANKDNKACFEREVWNLAKKDSIAKLEPLERRKDSFLFHTIADKK